MRTVGFFDPLDSITALEYALKSVHFSCQTAKEYAMGYIVVFGIGYLAGVLLSNPTKQFFAGLTKKSGS